LSTKTQFEKADRTYRRTADSAKGLSWLLPSITDLIFVCVLFSLSMGAFSQRLLGDADIGWHIRNGELMLRTHALTRVDPFSSSMSGKPWYAWEWLYDLLVGSIHRWAGLNGVVLLTAFVVAFTFAFVLNRTLQRGGLLLMAIPFLIFAFAASAIHLFARPHVFTWLLAVIFFVLLDSAERSGNWRPLLWLPVIILVWTNLHGGFVLGFVLLAIFLLSAGVKYVLHPSERNVIADWIKKLGLVSGACALASLVNPYGYKLHMHIYRYLTDRWLMNHIDEFLSPNLHEVSGACFVILVLLTFFALSVSGRKISISSGLVLLFAIYSGFYASRNLPVSSLLLMLVSVPLLSEPLIAAGEDSRVVAGIRNPLHVFSSFSRRMEKLEERLRGHIWPAAAVIFAVIVCWNSGRFGSRQLMNAQFNPKRFPVQAAGFMAQHNIAGPVFSPDSWGGYLIYRLYPRTRVYLDDRHDFYGDTFFKDYLKIIRISPEWQQQLDATGVQWVLVPEGSSLANVLKETKQWTPLYEDSVAVLFHKELEAGH
jgi:hypothetical protein